MIKQLVDQILLENNFTGVEVLEIFETGSQIFNYGDPSDLDYVAICRNFKQYDEYGHTRLFRLIDGNRYDILLLDETTVQDRMDLRSGNQKQRLMLLFNYFYPLRNTVYGGTDYDFNMFLYEEEYLNIMKQHFYNTVQRALNKYNFGKAYVHYYIILKIYENNSVEITDAMIQDIHTLYDRQEEALPIIEWIEEQIRNIPEYNPGEEEE